jgi:hypothetical protein
MKTSKRFLSQNQLSALLHFPPLTLTTGLAFFLLPV